MFASLIYSVLSVRLLCRGVCACLSSDSPWVCLSFLSSCPDCVCWLRALLVLYFLSYHVCLLCVFFFSLLYSVHVFCSFLITSRDPLLSSLSLLVSAVYRAFPLWFYLFCPFFFFFAMFSFAVLCRVPCSRCCVLQLVCLSHILSFLVVFPLVWCRVL